MKSYLLSLSTLIFISFHVNSQSLNWSTYYGGSTGSAEEGAALDISPDGHVYSVGNTNATDFPDALNSNSGGSDAWVVKMDVNGNQIWALHLGGSGTEEANDVIVGSDTEIYIVGKTSSTNYPTTAGAFDQTPNGFDDAFITKIDSSGTILWSTYFGGATNDAALGVQQDGIDGLYVTGHTSSPDFPVLSAYQPASAGGIDGFCAKFNTTTGALIWSTYLGGTGSDLPRKITLDPANNIYLGGRTSSSILPLSSLGFQPVNAGGSYDAYLMKLDNSGALQWSTFYGGTQDDRCHDIGTDGQSIYFTGETFSTDFPVTPGAFQTSKIGISEPDAFLAKFSLSGGQVWSTYFGTNDYDRSFHLTVGTNADVSFCGHTSSFFLPTTLDAHQSSMGGIYDAYVAKFDSTGAQIYTSYLGGSNLDNFYGIEDNFGNLYLTGSTRSSNYPVASAYQGTFAGGTEDVTLSKFGFSVPCNDPDTPTLSASATTICPGASATLNIAGNLNDATAWKIYSGSCGGTLDGSTAGSSYVVSPSSTTTYFVRGEGGCATPGVCSSITITVEDVTAPVPSGPLSDATGECSVTPTTPTAIDNCAGTVSGTPDVSFPITTQGTTVVVWTYDDGNGNFSSQTQNVVVNDVTAPVPDNSALADATGECSVTPTAPTATDNCTGSITATTSTSFPITTQGTTVVTWVYDDGNGNTSTQTQNVVVNDVTAPVPDNSALADATGECSVTPTAPTATDNCAGSITATTSTSFPITTQGTTVVTWVYDDGNGNTSTQTQNVIVNDVTAPVMNGCPGNSTVTADAAGCTSNVTWLDPVATDNCGIQSVIATPSSGSTFNLGTTTVNIVATDIGGNTTTCSFDVTVISDLQASVDQVTDVDCFGNSTGSIDVTTSGGTSAYTYDWNSGSFTSEDISGLSAGNYNLTVTDANGCTTSVSTTVNEPSSPLLITVDAANDPSSCGSADGSIAVTTSGGTPVYTYDWNGGTYTTEDLTGLGAGIYTLTATDANGCTEITTVSISDPDAPVVTINTITDATCNGDADGMIDVDVTGGTAPFIFDWDNDGTGDNDDNEDLINVGAGSYNLQVIDSAGCSTTISGTVNEPGPIDVTVTQSAQDLTATATGLSYQWIDCANSTPISGATSQTYTATDNGDYAVIITDGSCSDTSSCYTVSGVGFDAFGTKPQLLLYPNPGNGNITVEYGKTVQAAIIEIRNIQGQIIYRQTDVSGSKLQLSLLHVERGTYIFHLEDNDGYSEVLFVIQ